MKVYTFSKYLLDTLFEFESYFLRKNSMLSESQRIYISFESNKIRMSDWM